MVTNVIDLNSVRFTYFITDHKCPQSPIHLFEWSDKDKLGWRYENGPRSRISNPCGISLAWRILKWYKFVSAVRVRYVFATRFLPFDIDHRFHIWRVFMPLRNHNFHTRHDSKGANDSLKGPLWSRRAWLAGTLVGCCGVSGCTSGNSSDTQLVNVSYDPTREFYEAFNNAFAKYYTEKGNASVAVKMSHSGSGKQSRAVMDGIPADVVSLALPFDIDMIVEKTGLIDADWQTRFPHNASPYQSTIIFMVRKGNPRNIHSWSDLIRDDVQVITPNPKISGAARYNFLAAWGYVLKQELGDFNALQTPDSPKVLAAEAKAQDFLRKMFQNVPVLDSGARSATMTFTRSQIGDVLLNWENEAFLAATESNDHQFEMVVPEMSILAEPPVAVVDRVAEQHSTTQLAHDYLEYLYSDVGQTLAAKHYYRPSEPDRVEPSLLTPFQPLERFSVSSVFGSWKAAQTRFFNDGGVFDQIFIPK